MPKLRLSALVRPDSLPYDLCLRGCGYAVLVVLPLVLTAAISYAQQLTHVLHYTPPANVFRQAIEPAEDYSFNGFNASVQVYQFKPYTGNIQQAFQRTLLRDWIAPMHQEENVAGAPNFQEISVPGAQFAIAAVFAENRVGLPLPHMRILFVAGNEAAIVDASAGTMQSWQQALPALNQMVATIRIETARGPAALTPASGRAIAGLYQGFKLKYMASMYNVIGSGYNQPALHFYLFSADGRVYRAYDKLDVPGGAIARFDFDAAERNDPENSGRYTVDNGKLIIKMQGRSTDLMVTDVPREGVVTINTIVYQRKLLANDNHNTDEELRNKLHEDLRKAAGQLK